MAETSGSGDSTATTPDGWRSKPVSRDSVLAAMAELDRGDRDDALARHGFRHARDYVVLHDGGQYDSKALYGIAYGIEYPGEVPIRERGLSGGRSVTRKLEALGFEIKSLRAASSPPAPRSNARAWIIRAGRDGEDEDVARHESVALIGWSEFGRIGPETSRDELKEMLRNTGEDRERSIDAQASSIYRFIHDVAEGDVVVLPLQSQRHHASVGIVRGPFEYRNDGPF